MSSIAWIWRQPASFLALLTVLGGTVEAQETIYVPLTRDDGWQVMDAAEAGFDAEALAALAQDLDDGAYPNVHAVVIERGDGLVFEQYLTGADQIWGTAIGTVEFDAETFHDLRSITKSVTSMVLGIALEDDFEEALHRPLLSWFPERADEVDAGLQTITLRHALTMTSGLEWNEMTASYADHQNDEIQMYYKLDPLDHVLSKPMREAPGVCWYYNGGLTMLLAAVVQKITGQPFEDYTNAVLFEPLGIENYGWSAPGHWPQGLPSAASGLRLTVRDLAKIGSVMLHDGQWYGEQIVPDAWVTLSGETMRTDLGAWDGGGTRGYGFQWWTTRADVDGRTIEAVSGVGYGGQRLMIVPELELVVTVFAGNYFGGGSRTTDEVLLRVIEAVD